jgi:uncharacterized membrane protein required for colicin V production
MCAAKHTKTFQPLHGGKVMGTQFFWFYDLLLVGILVGITYKCTRQGLVAGVTNFIGMLLGFAIALGISAPAASYVYDRFMAPGIIEQITYMSEHEQTDDSARAAFETLRNIDMQHAVLNHTPTSSFLNREENLPQEGETLMLAVNVVDLSETGVSDGDLSFFGLDAQFDLIYVNVGNIDITAAERAAHNLEDIILARTISFAMQNHRISDSPEMHETLTRNLTDTVPGVSRMAQGSTDLVASLLLDIITGTNDANDLTTAININMVRPKTILPFRLLFFAIVFALISIIVSAVSSATHFIEYIPLVGRINAVLGGVMGFALAIVVIFMVTVTVSVIISLTGDNIIFINTMTVERTMIFRHVYNIEFLNF